MLIIIVGARQDNYARADLHSRFQSCWFSTLIGESLGRFFNSIMVHENKDAKTHQLELQVLVGKQQD